MQSPPSDIREIAFFETAAQKFFYRGINAVTVAELSESMRISKKTIYKRYESKEEVIRRCLEHHLMSGLTPSLLVVYHSPWSAERKWATTLHMAYGRLQAISSAFYGDLAKHESLRGYFEHLTDNLVLWISLHLPARDRGVMKASLQSFLRMALFVVASEDERKSRQAFETTMLPVFEKAYGQFDPSPANRAS